MKTTTVTNNTTVKNKTTGTDTTTKKSTGNDTTTVPTSTQTSGTAYSNWLAARKKTQSLGTAPTYASQNTDAINAAFDSIMNRKAFSYNLNEDQLYQQYKDKYTQQAKMGMMDTMGQAAALTGGYGSSYGQAVGQQAYDRTMQNLNDLVPQLYQQAYSMYQDEGDRMQNQYNMLLDKENTEYGRFQDNLNQWNTDRSYYTDAENDAYNIWANERSNLNTETQNNREWLLSLASTGYTPTDEELAAAGITKAQWASLTKGNGSGGGGRTGNNGDVSSIMGDAYQAAIKAGKSPTEAAQIAADKAEKIYPGSSKHIAKTQDALVRGAEVSFWANT